MEDRERSSYSKQAAGKPGQHLSQHDLDMERRLEIERRKRKERVDQEEQSNRTRHDIIFMLSQAENQEELDKAYKELVEQLKAGKEDDIKRETTREPKKLTNLFKKYRQRQ